MLMGRIVVKVGLGVSQSGRNFGSSELDVKDEENLKENNVMCFYCKTMGHIVASCPMLEKQKVNPLVSVNKFGRTCGV